MSFEKAALLALGLVCVLFFGCIGYVIWDAATAETFDLRKDSWTCTQHHRETRTNVMLVGKVMIPQTSVETVCDQWTARET